MTSEKKVDKWNKRKQCSAINCKNDQCDRKHVAFYRFPKDPDRCARWVRHLRNASLKKINSQLLHKSYRVCSDHFQPSQFKKPSDVHAGLKRNAVPTRANAPNPPPRLHVELKRKPPKQRQELPKKKRKQSHVVHPSNAGASTAASVKQPTGPSETNGTVPNHLTVISVVARRLAVAKVSLKSTPSQTLVTVPNDAVTRPTVAPQTSLLPPKPTQTPVTVPDDAVASPTVAPQTSLLPPKPSQTPVTVPDDAVARPTVAPQTSLLPPKPTLIRIPLPDNALTSPTEEPQSFLLPPRQPPPKRPPTCKERLMMERIKSLKSRVAKLKAEVKELKKSSKVDTMEALMNQLKKLLPAQTFAFVSAQIRESQHKSNNFRWTAQDKELFLPLLRASPKCYKLLSNIVLLPTARTLQKYVQSTGFKSDQNSLAMTKQKKTTKPIDEISDSILESVDDPAECSFTSLEQLEVLECPFVPEELQGPFPPEKLLMTPLRMPY
ncbi:uncharacterized protein LOC143105625 [Alosa pseudoharengus]|uniref:uncharacterized protein LOC143105625 n=1 Tax=Alosa pseudoharengus TaxID=34774 RepID=UPI003F8AC20A